MRERVITFLLALAALLAFYGLWLRPAPTLDPGAEAARPTTSERRGNGLAALYEWLDASHVAARSWRDRYTALGDRDLPKRGNLLVVSLPGLDEFHSDEFGALDAWVRRGNTLLIDAALIDQPGWAARRTSSAVADIEALTGIEFETAQARAERLDDTPLQQRVREADARDAKKGDQKEDAEDEDTGEPDTGGKDPVVKRMVLTATGPHALLDGVHELVLESDYEAADWALRVPYDSFVLTLARTRQGEGAFFEKRHGDGRILLSSGGSLFTNRALGQKDNARLFSNIVRRTVGADGVVLFDDLRQGLSANYDPARFYRDPRLYRTAFIVLALWFIWVLGGTRLRAPSIGRHEPSEADLVRRAGGLIARTVAPPRTALGLFDLFFARLARGARATTGIAAPGRDEQWAWLERHAAVLPQELDRLKSWYADAHAMRKVPLVPLSNLLDTLEQRLKT